MSLDWIGILKELAAKAPVLTGEAARCGDTIYNWSNGRYSIDQFGSAIRTYGPESVADVLNSLSPYINNTTMSDLACAFETKTGWSPVTCMVGTASLTYAGLKTLQWAYGKYGVTTPTDLIRAILEKHALDLLKVDYKALAKIIDQVIDGKVASILEDLKNRFPDAYKTMTQKDKAAYVAEVKKQEIKELPALIEQKKADITAAVAQSQTPAASAPTTSVAGMQNGIAQVASFNLQNALAAILYGINTAAPAIRETAKVTL